MKTFIAWIKDKLHRCAEPGCWRKGLGCYLPDDRREEPDEYVCAEHAHKQGYCYLCGRYFAGVESFEFGSSGLCHDCKNEADREAGLYDEDEWCEDA